MITIDVAKSFVLGGDEAKSSPRDDEFGFVQMANSVASALASRLTDKGYVIGIEGKWGSGKTTFANYVSASLREQPEQYLIRFEPWLVGARDALLVEFFRTLASRIDAVGDAAVMASSSRVRGKKELKLGEKIRLYGEWAAAAAIPVSGLAGLEAGQKELMGIAVGLKAFKAISNLFKRGVMSLEALKSQIVSDLSALAARRPGIRFCVVIDDLDRVEPAEAVEILRLVKKVADFPLLTYVLCFDRAILAEHVQRVFGARAGDNFLEKIFQTIISIPPQEPFALRRLLKYRLAECCSEEMDENIEHEPERELRRHYLLDVWAGKLLKTPRDVARLLDAVKFGWPMVVGKADFYDFVWLQLIKLNAPDLFRWLEEYLVEIGAFRDGGRPSDGEIEEKTKALDTILSHLWGSRYRLSGLDHFVPGVGQFLITPNNARVFELDRASILRLERTARLGSPSHWRRYFAFDIPSYAIADEEISQFREAASRDPFEAAKTIRSLASKSHDHPGHFLDIFLDRLNDAQLSSIEAAGVAIACGDTMDDVARMVGRRVIGGRIDIWNKAAQIVPRCSIADVTNLFGAASSVNWLAGVFRRLASEAETPNGSQSPIDQTVRDSLAGTLITRFRLMRGPAIFRQPEPLVILHCWRLYGNRSELQNVLNEAMFDDFGFVEGLNAMRSWVHSSEKGLYYPLSRSVIADFIDPDKAKERLEQIRRDVPDAALSTRATQLLDVFANH